jgi:hypothetical protein
MPIVVLFPNLPANNPMATTIGDATQFLDIDMDQLTRPGLLITNWTGSSDG